MSEGQARGGGSRPEDGTDASSFAGAETSCGERIPATAPAAFLVGRSAAEDGAWQAGVQQSILECFGGMSGMCLPSIAQPGMPELGWAAALAVTGTRASATTQKKASSSFIAFALWADRPFIQVKSSASKVRPNQIRFRMAFI